MLTPFRTRILLVLFAALLFPVAVITYNHLGEDCFITYRYAEQWARGAGVVYNVGDRVEGYSNFLWLGLLTGARCLWGSVLTASRWMSVSILSILVVVFGWIAMGKPEQRGEGHAFIPLYRLWLPLALWLNPFLHYHIDRGLETVLFAGLLGCVAIALTNRQWLIGGILSALVALTRPEGVFYSVAFLPLLIWRFEKEEGEPETTSGRFDQRTVIRHCLLFFLPVLVAWGGQTIFRIGYYHALLLNSAVAKLGRGTRPPASGEIARWIIASNGLPLIAAVGAVYGWKKLPHRRRLIAAAVLLLGAAMMYQVGIGRVAAVAYRYLMPAVPPTLILVFVFLEALHYELGSRRWVRRLLPVGLLFLAFYLHPHGSRPGTLFTSHGDAPRSRFHRRLIEFVMHPDFGERWQWWHHEAIIHNANAGRWMRDVLYSSHPGALLAADQMGALGYYASLDQSILDLGGLMDKRIAHSGLKPAELVERSPDFLVLYALRSEEEPILPELKELVRSEVFQESYVQWWNLVPRDDIQGVKFIVYGKRDGAPATPETVVLGPSTEEFERRWRVLD